MSIKNTDLRIGNILIDNLTKTLLTVDELGGVGLDDHIHVYPNKTSKDNNLAWQITGLPLSEEILLKCGYKFYNGKSEGDLCMDFGGKLDVDFIDGKIKVKSHYEEYTAYRTIFCIEYLHQLQNLYFALTDEELNTSGLL